MRASSRRDIAPSLPPAVRVGADTLTASFLSGRNARTLAAYRRDLEDFRAFLSAATVEDAGRLVITAAQGDANAMAHAYRIHLVERGLQAATINRRLAALRSLVKLANTVGLIPWRLSVESLKSQAYRDTRGPGGDVYREVLAHAGRQRPGKAARDVAILRLLHDIGLRRGEVVGLNLDDVDLARSSLMVKGKARTQAARSPSPLLPRPPWWLGSPTAAQSPAPCSRTSIEPGKAAAGSPAPPSISWSAGLAAMWARRSGRTASAISRSPTLWTCSRATCGRSLSSLATAISACSLPMTTTELTQQVKSPPP